jgi:hypothetical protein
MNAFRTGQIPAKPPPAGKAKRDWRTARLSTDDADDTDGKGTFSFFIGEIRGELREIRG